MSIESIVAPRELIAEHIGVQELDLLRLKTLLLEQQLSQERLNVLVLTFLQGEGPAALQSRINQLAAKIQTEVQAMFTTSGLNPEEFQFNLDRGVFVRRDNAR